jgi:hypothetical protein
MANMGAKQHDDGARHEEEPREYLHVSKSEWSIEMDDILSDSKYARMTLISPDWPGQPSDARGILEQVLRNWPSGARVKVLQTCAGFIVAEWPSDLPRERISDNREPDSTVTEALFSEATRCVESLMETELRARLSVCADYFCVGVDLCQGKSSGAKRGTNNMYAQLVGLIDLRCSLAPHWTGKSHPTFSEVKDLVRISDIDSHFTGVDGVGKAMLLLCHDLWAFDDRGKSGEWRSGVKRAFRDAAAHAGPVLVLHLPHSTKSVRTWHNPQARLLKAATVQEYVSSGTWPRADLDDRLSQKTRSPQLERVLSATKHGHSRVVEIIVRPDSA